RRDRSLPTTRSATHTRAPCPRVPHCACPLVESPVDLQKKTAGAVPFGPQRVRHRNVTDVTGQRKSTLQRSAAGSADFREGAGIWIGSPGGALLRLQAEQRRRRMSLPRLIAAEFLRRRAFDLADRRAVADVQLDFTLELQRALHGRVRADDDVRLVRADV